MARTAHAPDAVTAMVDRSGLPSGGGDLGDGTNTCTTSHTWHKLRELHTVARR